MYNVPFAETNKHSVLGNHIVIFVCVFLNVKTSKYKINTERTKWKYNKSGMKKQQQQQQRPTLANEKIYDQKRIIDMETEPNDDGKTKYPNRYYMGFCLFILLEM